MRGHLGIVALLCAALVAGCGGDDEASSGGGEGGVTKVKVGVLPIANAAPLYIARDQGFFKEEGIEIEPRSRRAAASSSPPSCPARTSSRSSAGCR